MASVALATTSSIGTLNCICSITFSDVINKQNQCASFTNAVTKILQHIIL